MSSLLNSSCRVFPGTVESLWLPLSFLTQTWNYRETDFKLISIFFCFGFLNHWISRINLFCKHRMKNCGLTTKTFQA